MEAKKPHFFSVMIDDFDRRLRIPQAFLQCIAKKSSEMVILEGPSGSCWCVRLKRTIDGMYLEDGWGKFARAHSLREGEFLVFRYDGNTKFTVQIFDSSTLEKEDAFKVANSKEEIICDRGKKRLMPQEEKQKHHTESWGKSKWPCNPTQSAKRHREDRLLEQKKPHQSRRSNTHKDGNILVKHEPIQASRTTNLEHPFFEVVIRPSYIHILPIPIRFSRRYFTKEVETVTIMVPDGRTRHIRCSKATQGFYQLSKGWNYFKKEMNLSVGNICVFEMIGDMTFLLNASKKRVA
ncbi:B3 domain-containing protein [Thalictrum thalictroides]|uniref:B3 domain-containing protein n=1 Tax=Thalictrum thalictroides TaxID=46969 RepID=A0A7J6VSA7_THATH|nr:B3 domain-containing protein [Thalictrum thalictroides]